MGREGPDGAPRVRLPDVERRRFETQFEAERRWNRALLAEDDPMRRVSLYDAAYRESSRIASDEGRLGTARGFSEGYASLLRALLEGKDVLEIGSGQGHAMLAYAPFVRTIVGVEVNPDVVGPLADRLAREGPRNASVLCGAAQSIELSPGSFDVVVSNDTWEHLHPDDAAEATRRAFAALRPGGAIAVATVNRHSGPHDVSKFWLARGEPAAGHHLREWSYRELGELLRASGFVRLRTYLLAPARRLARAGLLAIAARTAVPIGYKLALERTAIMRRDTVATVLGLQNVLIVGRKPRPR